jgi:hypothetical protein
VIEKMTPMPWNGNGIFIIYRYWYGNGIQIRKLTGNETVLGFMKHFLQSIVSTSPSLE